MSRSYFFLEHNLNVLNSDELLNADAIVIEILDLEKIFDNFQEYGELFKKFLNKGIKIYAKLDSIRYKMSCKILDKIDPMYVSGWFVPHSSRRLLNRLTIKAREYEVSKRISYGTITFVPIIDTPSAVIDSRKIANYERVTAIYIDCLKYQDYLGLDSTNDNSKTRFIRERVSLYNDLAKKELIDSMCIDDKVFQDDLEYGKTLGASSKATNELNQILIINQTYTPTNEEIKNAQKIINLYNNSDYKKIKRYLFIDGVEISSNMVVRSYRVLSRAKRLGLTFDDQIEIEVVDEKVKKVNSKKPMKFYTFGEEIGNAVTHGVGILLGLVFFVMLLIKGVNSGDNKDMIAYVAYTLSIIILYFMSTMYHGLPVNSNAKRLFQKFDHMTIYLLIAGTYTPYSLLAIGGNTGLALCIFLWIGALIGLLLNLFWFGKFKKFHMFLYLALGWVAIFFLPTIINNIGVMGTVLLFAGGVSYTLGTIFYSMKLFKYTHMVWHIFVIIGTILHFLSIYIFL